MLNFEHYTPTDIVFGKDTEKQVGELVKKQGCSKVLVHYGSNSAKKSGLLDRVFDSLNEAGVDFVELGGVVPNPRLSKVYEGIELAKKENVDFLLAVGGGSVIDSAKAIAYAIANPDVADVWDFYMGKAVPKACAPVGVILTIAAAGSETSNSSVVTNEEGKASFFYGYGDPNGYERLISAQVKDMRIVPPICILKSIGKGKATPDQTPTDAPAVIDEPTQAEATVAPAATVAPTTATKDSATKTSATSSSATAKTGDNTHLWLWVMIAGLCLCGIIGTTSIYKKHYAKK